MHHNLKCHPPMFRALRDGVAPFTARKDDRAFQAGDTVTLRYHTPQAVPNMLGMAPPAEPFDPKDDHTPLEYRIMFVLRGGQYGIEPGYVVLGLERV